MDEQLPLGKLPSALLERLLNRYVQADDRLLVGPGIGHDAAAIALDDERAMVVKSDPITFATAEIGWYLVNVNANDLACLGATPRWLLVTALLPEGQTTPRLVESIFAGLAEACQPLGITLAGGHTEITYGLDRPILVGTLLGEAARSDLVTPGKAQPGDHVILTKGVAVEGTALIAGERREEVVQQFGQAFADRCQQFLHKPGISVVRDAKIALAAGAIGLHDPTEGGVATGLRELAQAAGLGLEVDAAAIPIYPETAALCTTFGLDPLGLIASGSLLVVAPGALTRQIVAALAAARIDAAIIGTFVDAANGIQLRRDDHGEPLPEFVADEITRLFATPRLQ